MIKVKNNTKRVLKLGGVSVKPYGIDNVPSDAPELGYALKRGKITIIKSDRLYGKEELSEMKMDKLREIGDPLGAKDTKKSELVEEILDKQEE